MGRPAHGPLSRRAGQHLRQIAIALGGFGLVLVEATAHSALENADDLARKTQSLGHQADHVSE